MCGSGWRWGLCTLSQSGLGNHVQHAAQMKCATWTEKEATRASFPESSATALTLLSRISAFILECVPDFNLIDILLNVEKQNPACSFVACPPRCLLVIFAQLLPNFTQVTHTHLSVFKAHKHSCLIQSSVPVCGRTFWVICALLDFSQCGHNGSWLRNRNEKRERRYLKKSRRWKGWPLKIQLDSLPVQQHNSNYTL